MSTNEESHDDTGFLLHLRLMAEQKVAEYAELLHERQRLDMRIERTKLYVKQLNDFLKAEGREPIPLIPDSAVIESREF